MKFAGLSTEECADWSLQMRDRCHLKKADKSQIKITSGAHVMSDDFFISH
jgi:hypothetical protein